MSIRKWILLAAALAPLPALAAPIQDAREFTVGLYAAYSHGEPDFLGDRAATTFAPHLLALIRSDQARTPSGDIGTIDWDPICGCQDNGGMKVGRVEVDTPGADRARAIVTLSFPGETTLVTLDLVLQKGAWRVADIHTKDAPSLVTLLEKSIRAPVTKAP